MENWRDFLDEAIEKYRRTGDDNHLRCGIANVLKERAEEKHYLDPINDKTIGSVQTLAAEVLAYVDEQINPLPLPEFEIVASKSDIPGAIRVKFKGSQRAAVRVFIDGIGAFDAEKDEVDVSVEMPGFDSCPTCKARRYHDTRYTVRLPERILDQIPADGKKRDIRISTSHCIAVVVLTRYPDKTLKTHSLEYITP